MTDTVVVTTGNDALVTSTNLNTSTIVTNTIINTVVETVNNPDVIQSVEKASSTVVTSGIQGPPGISGASATISYTAGATLSGGVGVVLEGSTAIAASSTNLSHAGKLSGVTTGSALLGSLAIIQTSGELDGFFGLTINSKVYLQANGTISSVVPTSGFIQQVGIALTSTKILINIQPPLVIG